MKEGTWDNGVKHGMFRVISTKTGEFKKFQEYIHGEKVGGEQEEVENPDHGTVKKKKKKPIKS